MQYQPPPTLIDNAHIGESPSTLPPIHKYHKRSDSLRNQVHEGDVPVIPSVRLDTLKLRRRSASAPQPSPIFESAFEEQQDVSDVLQQSRVLEKERQYWNRIGNRPLARSSNNIGRHFSNIQPLNKHNRSTSHGNSQSSHKRITSTSSNKSSLGRSQSLSVPTKPLEIHLARSNSKHLPGCGRFIRKAWSFNKENIHPQDVHLRVESDRGNLHIRNQGRDNINILSEEDKIRIESANGQHWGQVLEPSPSTSQVGLALTSPSPAPPESSLPVHSQSVAPPSPAPVRKARSVATYTEDLIPPSQRRIIIPQRNSSKRFSHFSHQQSPSKSMIIGNDYIKSNLRRRSTSNSSAKSMSASSRSMTYDYYLSLHRDDASHNMGNLVAERNDSSLGNASVDHTGSIANHSIASDMATIDHQPPPLHASTSLLARGQNSNNESTSSVIEELRDAPIPPERQDDLQTPKARQPPPMRVEVEHITHEDLKTPKKGKSKEPPSLTITLPPRDSFQEALQSPLKEPPQAPKNEKHFKQDIDNFLYIRDPSPAPPKIPLKSPRRKSPNPSVQSSPNFSTLGLTIGNNNNNYNNKAEPVQRVANAAQAIALSGRSTPDLSIPVVNKTSSDSRTTNRSRSNSAMKPSATYIQPSSIGVESKPLLVLDVETVKTKLRTAKEARALKDESDKKEEEAKQVARIAAFRRSRVDRNGTTSSQRSHPFANVTQPNESKTLNTVCDSLSKRLSSDAYLNNLRLSNQQVPRLKKVSENDINKEGNELFYKPRPTHLNNTPIPPPTPEVRKRSQMRPSLSSNGSNISGISSQSGKELKPKPSLQELEEMLRNLKLRRARILAERENEQQLGVLKSPLEEID
ncbi:hypothetical protein E3Q15_02550 [Wallemia mellicola]|nr:hypothetical protein E3Q15_02550 [Wallemia mellicola]